MHSHLIIGAGSVAHEHAKALAERPERAMIAGVVDADAERAATFAARHGVARGSNNLATELRRRPSLAHVCSPPQTHLAIAIECLNAGVPVLLEKPPALNLGEMDDLIAASQRTGVHVGVVFQNRFGGAGVVARRLLTEGVIGRPLVAVCQTLWFRPEQYYDVTWRGRWEIEGGGPTMGLGIHQIDLLRSLIGPWREVSAMAGRLNRRTNTEDVSAASVRFENGALGSIITSLLSPREHSYLRIDTDKVTLEASYGSTGYSDSDWTLTPLPDEHALLERWTTDPGPRSDHGAQLDAVLDALDERAVLPVSLADARETLELVVAIYASAFTGVTVRKGDIVPGHPFYSRTDGPGAPWAAVKH